jgi:multidrug efflux pump subunit AcrA (membrane-fusion protein)
MRHMNKRLTSYFRVGAPLVVVGAALWLGWSMLTPKPVFETQGLIQAEEVKLASPQGGLLKSIWVKEGQAVKIGTPLAQFDGSALTSQLNDTKNALKQAQLNYQQLTQKASPRDITQAQARVQQAQQQLQLLNDGPTADVLSGARARQSELASQLMLAEADLQQAEQQVAAGVLAKNRLDAAQAQVTTLRNSLNAAKASVTVVRAGARPEQRAIARAELAAAQAQLGKLRDGATAVDIQLAAANVEKARIAVSTAEDRLKELTLKAPINGVVGVIATHVSELVQPGKPIITVVNMADMWVDIYLPEKLLPTIKLNAELPITSPTFPGKSFHGRVVFISPKSEFIPASGTSGDAQESATFRIKLMLDADAQAQLHPGMKVAIRL